MKSKLGKKVRHAKLYNPQEGDLVELNGRVILITEVFDSEVDNGEPLDRGTSYGFQGVVLHDSNKTIYEYRVGDINDFEDYDAKKLKLYDGEIIIHN